MIRARFYVGSEATTLAQLADRDPLADIPRLMRALDTAGVDGATIIPALGLWRGAPEVTLVVEIIGDLTDDDVRRVASVLRFAHDQDTVLWTAEPIHSGTVDRPITKGNV